MVNSLYHILKLLLFFIWSQHFSKYMVKYKTITHSCADFPTIQNVLQYSVSFFPKIFRGYRKAHDIFEINPFITKLCGTDKIFKTDSEIEAFRTMRC